MASAQTDHVKLCSGTLFLLLLRPFGDQPHRKPAMQAVPVTMHENRPAAASAHVETHWRKDGVPK